MVLEGACLLSCQGKLILKKNNDKQNFLLPTGVVLCGEIAQVCGAEEHLGLLCFSKG